MTGFFNFPSDKPATTYQSGTVTVGTSATLLCTPTGSHGVLISASVACFIGGSGVTAANGLPIPATTLVTVPTLDDARCALYAVSASSSNVSFCFPTP
jgi:hypothetical protein